MISCAIRDIASIIVALAILILNALLIVLVWQIWRVRPTNRWVSEVARLVERERLGRERPDLLWGLKPEVLAKKPRRQEVASR